MQTAKHPTRFVPLPGFRLALQLLVLSALTLTFANATAREGVVVKAPDGTRTTVHAEEATDAVAFAADANRPQLALVDVARTTIPATVIDFELDEFRPVQLAVYDLEGRLVCELARGVYARGEHRMAWHHENQDGEVLEDGVYVLRMTTGARAGQDLALAR